MPAAHPPSGYRASDWCHSRAVSDAGLNQAGQQVETAPRWSARPLRTLLGDHAVGLLAAGSGFVLGLYARRGWSSESLSSLSGVTDLERSKGFYEQLGWRGEEVAETVFFQAGSRAVVPRDRRKPLG